MILDSGARREFSSGAVRDVSEDKGRCDLLPLMVVGNLTSDNVLMNLGKFMEAGDERYIQLALNDFSDDRKWRYPEMFLEVSAHYAEGCQKYGERNLEKGIPCHCYLDSGVRHYLKWLKGDEDERHDRAFVWNMLGLLWTLKKRPEMNDLPWKKEQE